MEHKMFVRESEEDQCTQFLTVSVRENGVMVGCERVTVWNDGFVAEDYAMKNSAISQDWLDLMDYKPGDKLDQVFMLTALFSIKHYDGEIERVPSMQNPFHTWGILPRFS